MHVHTHTNNWHGHTHTHTHTEAEVDSVVGHNLDKALFPKGVSPEWPASESKTIACSIHLFIALSIPPSVRGGGVIPGFMSPELGWSDVF